MFGIRELLVTDFIKNLTMTTKKHMGIWMDHSVAHLMELSNDVITTNTLKSEFTHQQKEHSLSRGENHMHHAEQKQESHYYKKISDAVKGYEEVLLFGPTTAKNELHNLLKADFNFKDTKIEVKPADKMTEHQQHAFVKDHFKHSILHTPLK